MKRILLLCLLVLLCAGCGPSYRDTTRVLFIGNSYTFVNDLPKMFADLSKSGGHRVRFGTRAEGGWALADHVESARTSRMIESSKWDYVVLQEQSQTPASRVFRESEMYPAARTLAAKIREIGAAPVLFLTPAHLDGWPEEGMDYAAMQAQVDFAYYSLGRELDARVAPAGIAWQAAHGRDPSLALWQSDNSHPAKQGTYLTACVFYATIFNESPVGLTYRANLPKETAEFLQTIASKTVLDTP